MNDFRNVRLLHRLRERHEKRCALTCFCFESYVAAVQFHNGLGDIQTEPRSRPPPAVARIRLVELSEYLFLEFFRNAGTAVCNANPHRARHPLPDRQPKASRNRNHDIGKAKIRRRIRANSVPAYRMGVETRWNIGNGELYFLPVIAGSDCNFYLGAVLGPDKRPGKFKK